MSWYFDMISYALVIALKRSWPAIQNIIKSH